MKTPDLPHGARQRGTTLIEVMVTVALLAFGLLGIAAFQTKAQIGAVEAYQRAQALVLLEDMQARISANYSPILGRQYITTTPMGTDATNPPNCSGEPIGPARDLCEWSNALKGAGESSGTTKLGAMEGARGCIRPIEPRPNMGSVPGVILLLTVSWQGLHDTKEPIQICGDGSYGRETLRRSISIRMAIA